MMRYLRKKILLFIVYGIFITLVFLYFLFPGEMLKGKLEESIDSTDFMLRSSSLHPALPCGIKLKNVTISSKVQDAILFQGELLDLQFSLFNLIRKNTFIGFSGRAYDGNFSGRVSMDVLTKVHPPREGTLNFENIDIGRYSLLKGNPGKIFAGRASGTLTYSNDEATKSAAGTLSLFLKKGSYPLTEPFMGASKIDFDRGEIQAQLKNGVIKLEKAETFGPQFNCSFKGEIDPVLDFKNSQLNLNGTIEIAGKEKVKIKVTVGGTLTNPQVRYI
jgi:type II secretion system protein N